MDSLYKLIEKLTFFRLELGKASDSEKKFTLKKDIDKLETQIKEFRRRLDEADKNQDAEAKNQIEKEIKKVEGSNIDEILKRIYDLLEEQKEEKEREKKIKDQPKRDIVIYSPHKKTFLEKIGLKKTEISSFDCLKTTTLNDESNFKKTLKKYVGLLPEQNYSKEQITFFKQEPNKEQDLIILLSDIGMGKTMLMQHTFSKYADQNKYNLGFVYANCDIDYQLRRITDKLNSKNIEQRDFILFIDALDENIEARQNPIKYVEDLYHKVQHYKNVIISCRNQLFEDVGEFKEFIKDKKEDNQIISINQLDENQQSIFIDNYFKQNKKELKKSIEYKGAFKRPIVLKYADLLLNEKIDTSYSIYEIITQKLAAEGASKIDKNNSEQITKDLLKDAQKLAKLLFQTGKNSFSSKKLQTASKLKAKDLTRSFFTKDGGDFSFIHQVFYEYFLAKLLLDKQLTEEQILEKFPKQNTEVWQFYMQMLCKEHIGFDFDLLNMSKAREYERKKLSSRDYPIEEKCNLIDTLPKNLYARALATKFLMSNKVVIEPNFWFWYPYWEKVPQEVKEIVENEEWKSYLEAEEVFYEAVWSRYKEIQSAYVVYKVNMNEILKNIFRNNKVFGTKRNFLQKLTLVKCSISDVNFLENLYKLNWLDLSHNEIENTDSIAKMDKLTFLNLSNNKLTNIELFSNLSNLTFLDISNNKIENLNFTRNLKNLSCLKLENNNVKNIDALFNLKRLTYLLLDGNELSLEKVESLKERLPNCVIIFNDEVQDIIPIQTEQGSTSYLKKLDKPIDLDLIYEDFYRREEEQKNKTGKEGNNSTDARSIFPFMRDFLK